MISKEDQLVIGISMMLIFVIGMPVGVILAAWYHDPWWLLITVFSFLAYGWIK